MRDNSKNYMKKIIVPIDFSEDSITALKKAISMAGKLNAEITVVYVQKVKMLASIFGGAKPEEKPADIEARFKELVNHIPHNGIEVSYIYRSGNVPREICKLAEEQDAYLIVLGTHGTSGTGENAVGSNAYRVAAQAHCPVLAMRGDYKKEGIRKIVLPIDIVPTTRQKLPFAVDIAIAYRAEVHVLGILDSAQPELINQVNSYVAQVCQYLDDFNIKYVDEEINGANMPSITFEYATKVGADIIIIMSEEDEKSSSILGGHAHHMILESPIPVISVHRKFSAESDFSIM